MSAGGLPTFLDMRENFESSALEEGALFSAVMAGGY
jgi:hypothetical protein